MSLIADVLDAVRNPRAETRPPVPYTDTGTAMATLFGRGADPTERQLDLTTTESTLLSILDLISGDIAGVAWDLYRGPRTADMCPPDGAKPLTELQHLAVKLWHQPNDFMTGEHLRTVAAWHYDAVGEAWIVCQYAAPGIPESFWPVRPDRMRPRTDKNKFLVGYTYLGPSGERIPLELDEVLRITRPHPLDPHRGIGPVPALMLPLGTSLTSQQWIQAFFDNDATPGGIVQMGLDQPLDDDEWQTELTRWNEQHRGVSRAHRVGFLEIGTFHQTEVDLKKLQFTEMRQLTRDQILEAYQLNKFMLGVTDDVNRAASLAANDTYARRVLHRRVKKWHAFANGPYLKCFGSTGRGVTWCPENVIPEDEEAENTERTSVATAFKSYVDAGVPIEQVAAMFDLPFEATGPSGASPTEIALIAQKLYLSVGKLGQPNVIFSTEEARRVIEAAGGGAFLDAWTPPIVVEPDPPPALPPAPVPAPLPPAAGDDDPEGDDDET